MKKLLFSFLTIGISSFAFGQGIYNNGAFIVTTGPAQIYVAGGTNGDYLSTANGQITPSATDVITIEGDWTNNAGNTGFTADAGTVVLNGAAQTINGTSSTTFYNLTLQGSNTKTLNVNTSVGGVVTTTGILSLGSRPLDLNSKVLTVTNPLNSAITYSTGYIISETNSSLNPSMVQWNIGTSTTAHVVPFGTTSGLQIPFTVAPTIGMATAAGNFIISTRPTAASDNLPWASTVTQMYDPTLLQDGSDEAVIDRWWEITFSQAATANITFSYRGIENTMIVPYNTGNVGAQYWAASWVPNNSNIGSAAAVLAGVGSVTAPAIPFVAGAYTPMVLSSLSAPLPIELLSFNSNCIDNKEVITWSTATETNNDYFTIQRSEDGYTYSDIGTVNGAGTTTQLHNYSFTDPNPIVGTAYYQLRQTDFNGQYSNSNLIFATSCGTNANLIDAYASGSGINLVMDLVQDDNYTVNVFDARGRLILNQNVSGATGNNHFLLNTIVPATGVYLINVTGNSGQSFSKRLFISRD